MLPSVAAATVSACLFIVYRKITRDSIILGYIVGLGFVIRATLGVALFSISFLNLHLLAGLHTGDGFWRLAPDAKGYYLSAVYGAEHGLRAIPSDTSSIAFVQALSIWMMAVGTSPVSALLFNLTCYVMVCGILISNLRAVPERWRSPATVFTIGAFTWSPQLILYGTQPLKDMFFALLAVVLAVAARRLASTCSGVQFAWREMLLGLAGLVIAIYLMAGIRAYYPFLVWICLGILFVTCGALCGWSGIRRVAITGFSTLLVAWIAFTLGAGAYAVPYESLLGLHGVVQSAAARVASARAGFVGSGGAPNTEGGLVLHTGSRREQARAFAVGLLTLFVPMSTLRSLSIVHIVVRRSMLLLTDLDTLFLDASFGLGLLILIRGRVAVRPNLAFVAFTVSLTLLLAGLMGYVVTNYGTLVRLRLMVAFPMWTLPLAMCRSIAHKPNRDSTVGSISRQAQIS